MLRVLASMLAVALAIASPSFAQDAAGAGYPTRTVTIVSPTTSGTAADIISRTLAPRLQQKLGRPFVVENRTGASGNIGVGSVAKGTADGHLLLISPSTMAITSLMTKDLGWDPIKDLQPIARLAFLTMSIVVHPSVPAQTMSEFIALARQKGSAMNYASPGNGTPQHLTIELLKQVADLKMTHVPYKGTAGAVTDLLGGRVDVASFPVHVVISHVKAGRLRMLATIGEKRTPWSPDVPTLAEQGVQGVDIDSWVGMFGPMGTPPRVVERLTQEVTALLTQQDVRDALFEQGVITNPGGPQALLTTLVNDMERYRKVIATARLTLD